MNDALGTRMKSRYEWTTKYLLPRRTYTILRVDGRAFHTYCRGMTRPYDEGLMADMDTTAVALCREIMGARFAYVQSDEISLLLTDFDQRDTEPWFDGKVQKMASVSASIATAMFNRERTIRRIIDQYRNTSVSMEMVRHVEAQPLAQFDARVFTIPDPWEVFNYFRWRQQDCVRNSISMTAHAHFSPKQLHGKSCDQMQELLFQEKGINWSQQPAGFKNGRWVTKVTRTEDVAYTRKDGTSDVARGVTRQVWVAEPAPNFMDEYTPLFGMIPTIGYASTQTLD